MNLRRYENLLKIALRNTINETKRLNISKEEKFRLIIKAYKKRDPNLLKNTIINLERLVKEQKKIYSRLERGVNNWYKLIKTQSKLLFKWYHFFEDWFSNVTYFLKLFEDNLILAISDINYQLEKQLKILNEISKNPLEEFFKYKIELNSLYKQELEDYYLVIGFPNIRVIDKFHNELSRLLRKCKDRLKKVPATELQILNNKIDAILFLLVCVDLLKSIEFNENWLEEIFQQVTEIEELYAERGSRFNLAAFIANMNNMDYIIRH